MPENEYEQPTVHVVHQPDGYRIARAQNGAVNGRLFLVLLFLLNAATWTCLRDPGFALIALLTIAPVGCAVLADQMSEGPARVVAHVMTLATAGVLWLATFAKLANLG